jgi:hypothetical protein
MLGGAWAASNSSDGGKATSSAKAKRGPRGPKGATGPAGPAGPQGLPGANGKDGSSGANGQDGTNGANGTNGQSVTTASEPPFGNCGEQEGVKLTSVSGASYVCDGADGAPGSPWTAGGTLPVGSTETGAWTLAISEGAGAEPLPGVPIRLASVPISFNVPLAAPLAGANVHYVSGAAPSDCENASHPGTASAENPEAKSGHLCIYQGTLGGTSYFATKRPDTLTATEGAGITGADLQFAPLGASNEGHGTWAVTG